jgi:diadenosine tetraphosphate (Ap4A) HIT family hydrolase/ribosomal protein S18 acetylase RimI-like enzyme
MLLRAATAADVTHLCALWAAAGVGGGGVTDRAEIVERLKRDPALFVVAEDRGTIIGSVMGCYDGHRGWLKRVAVAPDRQGSGLGRLLVEETERRFVGLGITKLRLSVAESNDRGLAFWAHMGYRDSPELRYHERTLLAGDELGTARPWADRWPDDWSARLAGDDCPMCASLGQDHPSSRLVATGRVSDVRLERNTRFPGYCIVIWNGRHVAEPSDLDPASVGRYWSEVMAVGRSVRETFRPVKVNYLTLGNTVPHLHTHVVPRTVDDPAAGGPIPWELVHAEIPIADDDFEEAARRLGPAVRIALEEAS